jgi:hypothetical protein
MATNQHAARRHGHSDRHDSAGHPGPGHARHGHHGHHRRSGQSPWLWVGLTGLAFVIVWVLVRVAGGGSYYEEQATPEVFLARAERELEAGQLARALDSVQMAEMRKPDDAMRQRAQDVRARIKAQQSRSGDEEKLDSARRGLAAMTQFETTYLVKEQPRPAVREIARMAKAWLASYAGVVRRYPDQSPDVAKVQAIADRYTKTAELEKPDDHTDILFGVERRLGLPQPLYREALMLLDGYIAARKNSPNVHLLESRRADVVKAAREAYERHEADTRKFVAVKNWRDARKSLTNMREAIVVNGWVAGADALDQQITAGEKGS